MLVVPIIMLVLMLKGMGLIPTLLLCDLVAIAINLGMGFVSLKNMVGLEGPIVLGIDGMVGIIMFVTFLFIVIRLSEASGAFGTIVNGVERRCHTAKQAELATAGITTVGVFCRCQQYDDYSNDWADSAEII